MDSPLLLEDEKFDFDLPLSPDEERKEDYDEDDEIFFGPVGHNERCVAVITETKASKHIDDVENLKPLSPLNPEHVVEIFKEATSMALMFKTSCSEDVLLGRKSSSDCPELICDVAESRLRALKRADTEVSEDNITLGSSTKLSEKPPENDDDNFVVRKRVLKDRNIKSSSNKESAKTTITKPQLVKKGQTAAQNKSSGGGGGESKLQKFKTNPKSTYQNSKADTKKSGIATPRKLSSTSDRSFSSTKSSSTSDTSFTEETAKQSKLTMPAQSGLKPPDFSTGHRKRRSSNSSTSSTSSTSALNETFPGTKSSGLLTSSKQSSSNKSQPNPKPPLTKFGLSRPTFAKPNEVPKTSKLQPLKAQHRTAAPSSRSMSATGPKSPAQNKNIPRAASAGSTPLRAQTPKADRTPSKGNTPIRRRSSINTSASVAAKKRQSSLVPPTDVAQKATTPTVRRSTVEKGGRAGKPLSKAVSGLAVLRKADDGKKGDKKTVKPGKDTKQVTPESKRNTSSEKSFMTPTNTGEKQRNSQISRSVNCKRRSFIPTPNLNRTMESNKSVDSDSPSPVPFKLSPTISKQSGKTESNEENCEQEVLPDFNISEEERELGVAVARSPESLANEEKVSERNLSDSIDEKSFGSDKTKSPDAAQTQEHDLMIQEHPSSISKIKSPDTVQTQEHDLMIQESPPSISQVPMDDFVDPFSPGIPTPDLPNDECLNPVVLQIDTKDLIDLSHMSPKPEPDLIDLAAESPVHLVEAKLVDI